ncbi:MAG TPA: hypothetical protein VFA06_04475 [Actinocrinis sp.]|nr:hypothetical protein [Actinocrinis sp.]HZU55100.1 hypothetical protein [Actinocrinis sp.]
MDEGSVGADGLVEQLLDQPVRQAKERKAALNAVEITFVGRLTAGRK